MGKRNTGTGTLAKSIREYGDSLRLRDGAWVLRYTAPNGRRRQAGLGRKQDVTEAEARAKADAMRAMLRQDPPVDPLNVPKAVRDTAAPMTLRDAAEAAYKSRLARLAPRSALYWLRDLDAHIAPLLRMPLTAITFNDVVQSLEPLWTTKNPTAVKIALRLQIIFNYATDREWLPETTRNPAEWSRLTRILSPPDKVHRGRNMPSLHYKDVPAFTQRVMSHRGSASPLVIRMIIFDGVPHGRGDGRHVARNQLRRAAVDDPGREDEDAQGARCSAVEPAMEILAQAKQIARGNSPYVFTPRGGQYARTVAWHWMKRNFPEIPAVPNGGFRSSFRDWAAECSSAGFEVAEKCLAHETRSGTVRRYQRSDQIPQRRALMEEWAAYCMSGEPVPIAKRKTRADAKVGATQKSCRWPKKGGLTLREIGERVGITARNAHYIVKKYGTAGPEEGAAF